MALTALWTSFASNQRSSSLIHRGLISQYTARMAVFVGVGELDIIVVSEENY